MKNVMQSLHRRIRIILIPIGSFILIWIQINTFFILGYVPSASMEPTIPAGSIIIALRDSDVARGSIAVFRPNTGAKTLVKRVVAVAGDTILLNGENSETHTELVVPDNCYYMLGDNKACSLDSRYWENPFISREQILAKVICIINLNV